MDTDDRISPSDEWVILPSIPLHYTYDGTFNEELLARTDEDLMFLLYDTGRLYLSGEDPIYIIEQYISRIKHIHLKDVTNAVAKEVKKQKNNFLENA